MLKNTWIHLCALMLLSAVHCIYAEDISIPRPLFSGIRYGMPGHVTFSPSSMQGASLLRSNGGLVHIGLPSTHLISRGGKQYSTLTIGDDGRVFLGSIEDGEPLPAMGQGDFPQVILFHGVAIEPEGGSQAIPVQWSFERSQAGNYTVIEIGPFHIIGASDSYTYQVLLYTDGEIQVSPWVHVYSDSFLYEHETLPLGSLQSLLRGSIGLYSMGDPVQWMDETLVFYQNSSQENLIQDGRLIRKGWVAHGNNAVYPCVDPDLHIWFELSGTAVISNDYSREHPVLGSFRGISVQGSTRFPESVNTWYFDELSQSMPYVMMMPLEIDTSSTTASCRNVPSDMTIPPCFYRMAWLAAGDSDLEMRSAAALKFAAGEGNEIDLDSVSYTLRQPRTIQFGVPERYTLTVQTDSGGSVNVSELPVADTYYLTQGDTHIVQIHPLPGKKIQRLIIDGTVVYNGSYLVDMASFLPGWKVLYEDGHDNWKLQLSVDQNHRIEVAFSGCWRFLRLYTPSHVAVTSYLDDPAQANARSSQRYVFYDAFGNSVQTQTELESGGKEVQVSYRDAMGRVRYQPLSYDNQNTAFSYVDMACYQCITQSHAYHDGSDPIDRPNDDGYPYAEARYGGNTIQDGILQSSWGLGKAAAGLGAKPARTWAFPVHDSLDFMDENALDEQSITNQASFNYSHLNAGGSWPYLLTIQRDASGRYSQSITDGFGRTLASRIFDGVHNQTTIYEYDAKGLLERSFLLENSDFISEFVHNGAGQNVATYEIDRGLLEKRYDHYGRLRFVRSNRQELRGTNYFTAYLYDDHGRLWAEAEVQGGHSFEAPDDTLATSALSMRKRYFYGAPSLTDLLALNLPVDQGVLEEIADLNAMESDLGAVASYNDSGVVSLKAFSYDRFGRKESQWILYAIGNPPVRLEYVYNESGELVNSYFKEWKHKETEDVWIILGIGGPVLHLKYVYNDLGERVSEWEYDHWQERSHRERIYDSRGRLFQIKADSYLMATYDYTPRGRLLQKSLWHQNTLVYSKNQSKDVYGRAHQITYANEEETVYEQNLAYADPTLARLENSLHMWRLSGNTENQQMQYSYDLLGRLRKASGDLGGIYDFDAYGRLEYKHEKDDALSMTFNPGSYQPVTVAGMNHGGSPTVYYQYDASGYLVSDDRTHSLFRVGSHGLPEEIRQYSPQDFPSASVSQIEAGYEFAGELTRIQMAYDESGERIWREVEDRTTGNRRIEATIPGVGVYTSSDGTNWILSRLSLVDGGYRDVNGEAKYPVYDWQGNVRGVQTVGTFELSSAYSYYPYGQVQALQEEADAGQERWQNKAYDEEYEFYYFGARYFDPWMGMWTAPDPAGQFADPYAYGGDPVNYQDPNGEFVVTAIVVGAAIGAAMSLGTQAYQRGDDWYKFNRTNGWSVAKGAIVGGLAGAAGGVAGYYAGGSQLAASFTNGTATFWGSVGLGAASGAAGGAAGGFVGYSAGVWANNDFRSMKGFDMNDAAFATVSGAAVGGVMGGIGGAYSYNKWVNNAAMNSADRVVTNQEGVDNTGIEYGTQHDRIEGVGGGYDMKPGENATVKHITFEYQNEYTLAYDHAEPIPFNPMKTDLVNKVSPFEYEYSNFWRFDQEAAQMGGAPPYQFLSNRGGWGWETRVFLEGQQVGNTMHSHAEIYSAFKDIYWRW